jgi:tripartite-type tricarboxylate transporter receptor subunit TctC
MKRLALSTNAVIIAAMKTLGFALLALGLAGLIPSACAQAYPSGPLRLIVPFPPGGTADPVARAVAQKLAQQLGQQVIVDNRPDGHTLLSAPFSFSANPALFAKLPYDSLRDLVPITFLGATPIVLIVHPSVPARSVNDLIAMAKAKPGEINYGSAGNGTSNHLAAELFNQLAGIRLAQVPYKGAGPATVRIAHGRWRWLHATVLGQCRSSSRWPRRAYPAASSKRGTA